MAAGQYAVDDMLKGAGYEDDITVWRQGSMLLMIWEDCEND
jgi:hypothetical protein